MQGSETDRAAERRHEAALAEAQLRAIEDAFAIRDDRIAELRRELDDLRTANSVDDVGRDYFEQRLAAIESRLDEQEQTLRQTLVMMIEFFEAQASRSRDHTGVEVEPNGV